MGATQPMPARIPAARLPATQATLTFYTAVKNYGHRIEACSAATMYTALPVSLYTRM